MNLIKRLKNLYKLSEIELSEQKKELVSNILTEKPRLAQIIRKETPVDKFLKNNK
jgi:hypothetical protein